MRHSKSVVCGFVVLMAVVGVQAMGPANVISPDTNSCFIGWFGCPADVAMLQPDGTYACPTIDLVLIEAVPRGAEPNDAHGNIEVTCRGQVEFGGLNPSVDDTEVAALPLSTVCLFLPDACAGNGSLVANTRTIGSLAVCTRGGVPTTDMQEIVTPSGMISLKCSFPDPPPGG